MKLTNIKLNNKVITSKNNLNTLEIKVFLYLCKIYQVNEKNLQKDLFNNLILESKDIYEILNINYNNLKRTLINLKEETVIIDNQDKKTFSSLILKFTFFKSGEIEILIDKDLEELFKTIKKYYTILQEKQIYKLNYKHSLKLYMLFKKIQNQTHKRIVLTLNEINEMFGTKYEKYNYINNNILKNSIREINDLTDINVIYTPKKNKYKNIYESVVFDLVESENLFKFI